MFEILRTRHPETYEAMVKPGLIMNNTLLNHISFKRFLFGRHWKKLNDEGLETLGNVMLVFFILYSPGLIFVVAAGSSGHAA
jgi:hypothetical protein